MPRSGTKGLMRGLNLHPNVLCAQERFDYRVDHSQLSFPDSFLAKPRVMDRLQWRKLRGLQAEAAKKANVLFVGNKLPRYYLALDRINNEVPQLRNLVIYRSPYGFMPSWNRKEMEHKAARWHAGEVGLFGFLELLVCLQNAIRQEGVFVFPYDRGLNESTEPILAALDFIGADPSRFDAQTFVAKHLPKRAPDTRDRLPLKPYELEFLEKLHVRQLDEVLFGNWGVLTAQTATQLSDYLRSITPVLPEAIDEAFAACENPGARYYGGRYITANRRELAGLLELTEGSRFVADSLRFGMWRKLRYLYLQRSFLSRRLTSMRITEAR